MFPKLFTIHNNYLPLIKIFSVNNNCFPLIKLFTDNNNCLPLTEIFAVKKSQECHEKLLTVNKNIYQK